MVVAAINTAGNFSNDISKRKEKEKAFFLSREGGESIIYSDTT